MRSSRRMVDSQSGFGCHSARCAQPDDSLRRIHVASLSEDSAVR
jgi:hypothetical protein